MKSLPGRPVGPASTSISGVVRDASGGVSGRDGRGDERRRIERSGRP